MSETARGWLLVSPIWTAMLGGVIYVAWKTFFKKEKPIVSPPVVSPEEKDD